MAGKMRMGMFLTLLLFVIYLTAAAADAADPRSAKDPSFVPNWWERSQIVKKLELTEEQSARIKDLCRAHSKEIARAREALRGERARLRQLLVQGSSDDSKTEQQIEAVGSALSALIRAELVMHHAMLKELSEDQRRTLVPILDQQRGPARHKKSTDKDSERKRLEKRYNRF